MTQQQVITANVEIISCAEDEGKTGPQWRLEVQYPFSQFTTRAWVPRHEGQKPLAKGTYLCTIERGALKKGKDAGQDYNYNWRITKVGVEEGVGVDTSQLMPEGSPVPAPIPSYESEQQQREARIMRTSALKAAIDLWVSVSAGREPSFPVLFGWADAIFPYIAEGKHPGDAPETAQEPARGPSEGSVATDKEIPEAGGSTEGGEQDLFA